MKTGIQKSAAALVLALACASGSVAFGKDIPALAPGQGLDSSTVYVPCLDRDSCDSITGAR